MRIRRAISPVISSLLIITLVVASTSVVMVFLQNSGSIDVSNQSGPAQGQNATTVESQSVNFEVSKFTKKLNDTYYSSVQIKVDYSGPDSYILVYDVDIYLDGVRLDDYSEWAIVDSTANYTSSNGKFTGWMQLANTSQLYTVNLTDTNNVLARLPFNTGFTYKVALGDTSGTVTEVLTETHIAVNVYSPVVYNISILHYQQDINDPTSMLATIINMIKELNGSSKLYYRLNNLTDVYDSSQPFNGTDIALHSDLIINAEWAVNTKSSAEMMKIYMSGKPLLMMGSVSKLYSKGNVDNSTTHSITGVWYTPNTKNYKTKEYRLGGDYTWASSSDYLLQSLQGSISLVDNLKHLRSIGTYDDTTNQTTSYGVTDYQVFQVKKRSSLILNWERNASLVVSKAANMTVANVSLGTVITVPADQGIFDDAERDVLVRNAILSLLVEIDRIKPAGTLSIVSNKLTDLIIPVKKGDFTYWSLEVDFQVLDGDVRTEGLMLDYLLPSKYKYTNSNPIVYVTVGANSPVSSSFSVVNKAISLDLSTLLSGTLKQGQVVSILFTGFGEKVKKSKTCLDWTATLSFLQLDSTPQTIQDTVSMKLPDRKHTSYLC